MWQLSKMSDPGWDKDFPTKAAATVELRKHVCQSCIVEDEVTDADDADQLLATRCGCEFMLTDLQNSEP